MTTPSVMRVRGEPSSRPPRQTKSGSLRNLKWRTRSTLGEESLVYDGANFTEPRSHSVLGTGAEIRAPPRSSQRLKIGFGRVFSFNIRNDEGQTDENRPGRNSLPTVLRSINSSLRPHLHRKNTPLFASQRIPELDGDEGHERNHIMVNQEARSDFANDDSREERVRDSIVSGTAKKKSAENRIKVQFDIPEVTAAETQDLSQMISAPGTLSTDPVPRLKGFRFQRKKKSVQPSISGQQDQEIARAPQLSGPSDEVESEEPTDDTEEPKDIENSSPEMELDSCGNTPYAVFVGDSVVIHGVDRFLMQKGPHTSEPRAVLLKRGVNLIGKIGSSGELSIIINVEDAHGDCK